MSETYSGTGTLIADGAEHLCQYQLDVYEDRRMKTGSGFIVSTPDALWSAFDTSRCVVRMQDGRSFPIIVTTCRPGAEDAPFKMAGAFIEPEA